MTGFQHTNMTSSHESSDSDSTPLVIGLVVAAVLILGALGGWWMCLRRKSKRLHGPRNSHNQSTHYVDCVLTPDLMAIIADGSRRNSGFGGKWFQHVPQISSVPSMEFFDQLNTGADRGSSSAATTTATGTSPVTNGTHLGWLDKCDSSDEVAINALTLEQSRLLPQSVVEGELLHEGGFTLAFRATLKVEGQTSRQVVVRRLLPELAEQPIYRQAFMADISLSASLLHPRIVAFVGFYDPTQRVYDLNSPTSPSHLVGQAAQPSAVTEFMPNGDLGSLLKLRPRNAQDFGWFHSVSVPKPKAQLALDVVDALVYLHSRPAGVSTSLHPPEIKARRVLLSEFCDAKLCAFGVRRVCQAAYTRTDFSVAWLAPELLRGEPRNELADVYALGVLLTELDTCELPFATGVDMDDGIDEQSQLAMLVSSGCVRPALSMDCPQQIQELVMRCLSFSPQQRPPAVEVQHTLRKLINGTSVCDVSLASLPSNFSSLHSTPATLTNLFTP